MNVYLLPRKSQKIGLGSAINDKISYKNAISNLFGPFSRLTDVIFDEERTDTICAYDVIS